ncbi:hypothetical protein [Burkholderia vietnamiensis]|uniref:hypothetical protein n=1 Tax=Burkholderia vietnamiensis TaxID=60552 RepID=UPI000753C0DF|nr:hypothetical protein [Burkholderia vietnamiensis]KVR92142.1 hypothetical protein WK27_05860 [Burkholderia vietnamiensis]MCA8068526.1 hypothetical protein [Burkholderia vietnamiensis]
MPDRPYSVELVHGQVSVIQKFPITFATVQEAEKFAENIVVGRNEAVLLLTNGENSKPIKMGDEWPR